MDFFIQIINGLIFLAVVLTIVFDIIFSFFPNFSITKKISPNSLDKRHYFGLLILLLLVVWPSVIEADVGGFSVKRQVNTLAEEVEQLDRQIENLFSQYTTQIFKIDQIELVEAEDYNRAKVILEHEPIGNSIRVWFLDNAVGPSDYLLNGKELTVKLPLYMNSETLHSMVEQSLNLASDDTIVVSYIKKNSN